MIYILVLSFALQVLAASLALRLVRITGWRTAWLSISIAIALMACRRAVTIYHILRKEGHTGDLGAELVALAISLMMVTGMIGLPRLFRAARQSNEAIAESQRRYRGLFDESPSSLWEADLTQVKAIVDELKATQTDDLRTWLRTHPEDLVRCAKAVRIVNVNDATLEMYRAKSQADFLGGISSVLREDSLPGFREQVVRLADGETAFEVENVNYTLDGERLYVRLKLVVTPGYEDSWGRLYVASINITNMVRAQMALRHRDEQLARVTRLSTVGHVAAELAHEINQPLYAIGNYADACDSLLQAAAGNPDGGKLAEWIGKVIQQKDRAQDIVDKITRQTRNAKPDRSPFNINDLIEGTVSLVDFQLADQRVDLEFIPAGEHKLVDVDRVLIEQVLVNLIRNAIDAIESSSSDRRLIRITASRENDAFMRVSVADSGKGLSADEKLIFDPFFTTRREGMGLGLSICRAIITAHEGKIWVSTGDELSGAVFHFTIPLVTGDVAVGNAETGDQKAGDVGRVGSATGDSLSLPDEKSLNREGK